MLMIFEQSAIVAILLFKMRPNFFTDTKLSLQLWKGYYHGIKVYVKHDETDTCAHTRGRCSLIS